MELLLESDLPPMGFKFDMKSFISLTTVGLKFWVYTKYIYEIYIIIYIYIVGQNMPITRYRILSMHYYGIKGNYHHQNWNLIDLGIWYRSRNWSGIACIGIELPKTELTLRSVYMY